MSNFNPATSTRGYYDLVGLYYSGQSLTGFLFAKYRDAPIDFYQSCWNETDPFTGCKLTDELPTRGIVQHPLAYTLLPWPMGMMVDISQWNTVAKPHRQLGWDFSMAFTITRFHSISAGARRIAAGLTFPNLMFAGKLSPPQPSHVGGINVNRHNSRRPGR